MHVSQLRCCFKHITEQGFVLSHDVWAPGARVSEAVDTEHVEHTFCIPKANACMDPPA